MSERGFSIACARVTLSPESLVPTPVAGPKAPWKRGQTMADDFGQAAERHRRDAKKLAEHGRYQNAGHLIGFAAECLVKAELTRAGITIDWKSGLRCHFPALQAAISNSGYGHVMSKVSQVLAPKFLDGWTADLRYEPNMKKADAETRWQNWHKDVDSVFKQMGRP